MSGRWRGAGEPETWRANPFHRMRLGDNGPDRITLFGNDPRLGDIARGRELIKGVWRIAAERLAGDYDIPWERPTPSKHFLARLHSFSWLADLAALGPDAHGRISTLIETWVRQYGDWDDFAWDAALVAERLYAWLCHGRRAFEFGDPAMRPQVMRAIGRHAKLLLIAQNELDDHPQELIKAGAALIIAGVAGFPEGERLREQGEEILFETIAKQFLPDGMHQSRSPETLADALCDIVTASDALRVAGFEIPPTIKDALPRFANMLRLLRHGDGGLACFQGGSEGSASAISRVLDIVGGNVRGFRYATHAAYHRLQQGDLTLLFDVGAAPPPLFGERAHAGALAFEMSCGAERIIVNVGAARELEPEGRAAARTTNGHSTLVLADALSSALERTRHGQRFQGPMLDDVRRSEDEDGVTVQGRHDGYKAQFGLLHRRYLFVDAAGRNVRGIEELIRPMRLKSAPPRMREIPFVARFHLHPSVKAVMAEDQIVLLETPSGARWRLRTDAQGLALQKSAYWGGKTVPQETQQIVLSGAADPMGHGLGPPNRIRWALARGE